MNQNQRRILLIEPPFYRLFKDTYSLTRYPLSLGYLAGMIRKETKWSVMAYNADFSPSDENIKVSYLAGIGFRKYLNNLKDLSRPIWSDVRKTISSYKPSAIGISTKSQNFLSACNVAKIAKDIDKRIIVIVGDPHPSIVGSDVFKCPDIDLCVKGEGEITIIELLNALDSQKEFEGIPGIIYRKDSQIVENTPREFIKDLDSLPFPHTIAHEVLKDYEQYPLTAFQRIFATRGCPYNCFFCGSRRIWSRKVRFRSPENIIKEIKALQKEGIKFIHFDDDVFGINKQYIKELCNALIKHCRGLKWSCEFHVKLVNKQSISLLKAAGCSLIRIGIESGNNEILKKMRKNITIEEAISACKIIKKHGIELHTFFMVGFPQETEKTLNDTIEAIKKIKWDALSYSIFTPYPGTEAFAFCRENGLINDNFDISLCNHQSPANCFCMNISPEKFRILVSKIEKMIDRKNSINRMKRIFLRNPFTVFSRVQELGIGESLKKSIRIVLGK